VAESVGERPGVEGVVLARRDPVALTQAGGDAWVDRVDLMAEREQLLDQQPVRPLNRDRQRQRQRRQLLRHPLEPSAIVRNTQLEQPLAAAVDHAQLMLLAAPIDASKDL
jgi:hypothetical protein